MANDPLHDSYSKEDTALNMEFKIGDRVLGENHPVYVVAELSANHLQDFDIAEEIVKKAKSAGANAIKTQTYSPESLTIRSATGGEDACKGTIWQGTPLYELYSKACTPMEWQENIRDLAIGMDMDFFSTAFSEKDVEFLEELDVPVHKIASFEIIDIPLIECMASTGKPLIISTGMATIDEIQEAIDTAISFGAPQVLLLKCTSAYPAKPEEMHLATIPDMRKRFGVPVGLSDHSMDLEVPMTAVAMGACLVEKHLTLDRGLGGPDSKFSLEPNEYDQMVKSIRSVERCKGDISYGPTDEERKSLPCRRSLYAVKDIRAGEKLSRDNVRSIRPAYGLHPREMRMVLGKRAARNISAGEPLEWSLLSD